MKSIFDRSFHYVPAAATDVRKTFARIRREMREREKAKDQNSAVIKRFVLKTK